VDGGEGTLVTGVHGLQHVEGFFAADLAVLAYLARHAGKVCTHHMILKDVWGPGYGAESNYVRVYTHRLRKKMGDEEGQLLKTVPGIGYQLVPGAHSPVPNE